MKTLISLLGVILIVIGIVSLAYMGFTYTSRENIVQVGNVKVTADTEKTITIPPVAGGLSLVAGIVLVIIGTRMGKS